MLTTFPRKMRVVSFATALSILVSGCVTPGSEERLGADRGDDACRAQAVALDASQNYFAEDLLAGVMAGAATGALTGALGAALTGRNVGAAAAKGAIVGAVAGAAGAYWEKRMQGGRAQAILGIKQDIRREAEQLERTKVAFRQLNDCRKQQFAAIKADYKAKKLTKDAAEARWARERELLQRDVNLANSINSNIVKRGESFAYANEQVNGTTAAQQAKAEAAEIAKVEAASASTTSTKKTTAAKKPTTTQTAKVEDKELLNDEKTRQANENGAVAAASSMVTLDSATAGGFEKSTV